MLNASNAASGISIHSIGYGSRNFVSVAVQSGTLPLVTSDGTAATRAAGVDAIASINGAVTVGEGLALKMNSSALEVELTLDKSFGVGQTSFSVTGGGALFQLGPQVASNQQLNIGIKSVASSKLGNDDVGFLSEIRTGGTASLIGGKAADAARILEEAIRQVAVLRGRLGAFEKNTLETNINSLRVTLENVTASESLIRDADFAAETAALTRAQILTQAGTSVLATANTSPQTVLRLLGG
jgi:flagellin